MARIEISSVSNPYGTGELQLQGKVAMSGTLTAVTDNLNTASPLKLSTGGVQVASTLQITTNSNPYIDAEDGAGNNRFTVGRDPSSQVVNVDFASNPTGGTNQVGAIRTYTDGVNLAQVMSFRKDGNIGIGTSSPASILQVIGTTNIARFGTSTNYWKFNTNYSSDQSLEMVNQGGAGTNTYYNTKLLNETYQTKLLIGEYQNYLSFGKYDNHQMASLFNNGNFVVGSSSDLSARIGIKSSGSTSATTSLLVQNSAGSNALTIKDDKASTFNGNVTIGSNSETDANSRSLFINGGFGNTSNDKVLLYLTAWNNVAYGVGSKQWIYFGGGGDATSSKIGGINLGNNNYESGLVFNTTSGGSDNEVMRITNAKNVGIGTSYPTAKLQVVGSGSTSGTTSLLVQNSAGSNALQVKDDLTTTLYSNLTIQAGGIQLDPNRSLAGYNIYGTSLNLIKAYGTQIYIGDSNSEDIVMVTGWSVLIGTTTRDNSSILTLASTTRGFLPPRMTDAQVRAIVSPAVGLMAYNTDLDCPVFYSSAGWRKISHSAM